MPNIVGRLLRTTHEMTSTINTFYLSPSNAFVENVSVQIRLRAVIESIGEANQQLAGALALVTYAVSYPRRLCDISGKHKRERTQNGDLL